jgi:hypothetical protein
MNTAAATKINTANTLALSIGHAMEGGFFAGIVLVDGIKYGVVVAPREHGETEGNWGEYGKVIEAFEFADGQKNTDAMAAAGSAIATWAKGLDIDGHKDWYVPARDELELIYRNLKPGTGETAGYFRNGENPSSVPTGQLYVRNKPMQTTVDEFKAGGAEAMEEDGWYWSSSQSSAGNAFVQAFSGGDQYGNHKGLEWRVRAVRRFLIP